MEKKEYFPRKKLFEESQDLIATFYSKGEFFSQNLSKYSTMLSSENDQKDDFYYCLLLMSLFSNIVQIEKVMEEILKSLNTFRVKEKINSTEGFIGDIDIEEYILKNYVEKVRPKEYPSIKKISTFQLPEYQITLFIAEKIIETYYYIIRVIGEDSSVTVFRETRSHIKKLERYKNILKRKYGIYYGRRESYLSLKKKVVYRYRNRKIISKNYKRLMSLFEKIMSLKGIDFESNLFTDFYDYKETFDDRLYEIWLIRKSVNLLVEYYSLDQENIDYIPLFKARKNNTAAVILNLDGYRIEILFQNRKKLMPKEDLKWYYLNDNDEKEEIGAIPDLIFIKYEDGNDEPKEIVLIDAKNRNWTFENAEPIKKEVVQQIYILDNFISIFNDKYSSILLAHNNEKFQYRKYCHKDNEKYVIEAISLDMKDEDSLLESLEYYKSELLEFLSSEEPWAI